MSSEHSTPAPKELPIEQTTLKRVARPIRHVKYVPLKSLIFYSKDGPMEFSYEKKIKTPISKAKLVVEVHHVGLNPIDMKIRNGYKSGVYGEIGLGREYSGVVSMVGEKLQSQWHVGDEVFGIYFHPHSGNGCLQSSILVDPSEDPILLKPENISSEEASGSLYCLGAAFNILDKLQRAGKLKPDSNVLINGGTSSVGLFAVQLLKNYFHLVKKIVIITTSTGPEVYAEQFPDFVDDMIFINYLNCRGKASKPLRKMINEQKVIEYDEQTGSDVPVEYNQGKFDVVLDFIGGYDILAHSSSLIHSGGAYVTTVGDYVENYKTDVYDSWDNPSANARKMFGSMLWSYSYTHFHFDTNAKSASKNDWINRCGEFLEKGVVKCVIDKTYHWKEHKEAFSYMATQRAQGKLMMEVERF
ncbi:hypothetical protein HG537_0B05640 [Torulaspora globosa]|uniref:Enoyl reductase (ER) domain-containing protein n=1 Tax=Torulaspora globosa TaxID=48254 RepID=A0A7H9HRA6_9SACH|nr:hypothetical protein HG537_0B05640 [Torulaspora sp. CBS 2947]